MIYICGDSFGASDPDSDITPWHEQLECVNLSRVCATNLQISQQVDNALQDASFIIVLLQLVFALNGDQKVIHCIT